LISARDFTNGAQRWVQNVLDKAKGLPLGIDADAPFTEQRLTLAPGQMLVMYTDGITEARDAAGEEFGPEGVERALAGCARGAGEAVNRLIQALEEFQGQTDASDDRTIVVVEAV
jgi:sigma-B regulation protein RsbU (phosphoserine phosphatase)